MALDFEEIINEELIFGKIIKDRQTRFCQECGGTIPPHVKSKFCSETCRAIGKTKNMKDLMEFRG